MEKPTGPISESLPPNQSPSSPPPPPPHSATSTSSNQQQKRRLPTAEELVAHYEAQGLDSKEASLKVIEDLQTFLLRAVAVSGRGKKEKFMTGVVRKLDNLNTRLAIIDMKLDSKPGYPEALAIGVSAGAAVIGIGHVLPHVVGAIGQMWDAVRSTTASVKRVRNQPMTTNIARNAAARRLWVIAVMKDNDKKNILAVQTLRNVIMGATLMATTSILICCGLAAIISSTYTIKKPLTDRVYGAHGEFIVALKYAVLLMIYFSAFICHSLSIRLVNQVNFLINVPQDHAFVVTPEYVSELLVKAFILNTVGNRLFYAALPLLLWIFGPVLVFLFSVTIIPILYNLDVVHESSKGEKEEMEEMGAET